MARKLPPAIQEYFDKVFEPHDTRPDLGDDWLGKMVTVMDDVSTLQVVRRLKSVHFFEAIPIQQVPGSRARNHADVDDRQQMSPRRMPMSMKSPCFETRTQSGGSLRTSRKPHVYRPDSVRTHEITPIPVIARDRGDNYGYWYLRGRLLGMARTLGDPRLVRDLLDLLALPGEYWEDRSRGVVVDILVRVLGHDVRYAADGSERPVDDAAKALLSDCGGP